MVEGSVWISLLLSALILPPLGSTWGNPHMTIMAEVIEVEATVAAHRHHIIVGDAMSVLVLAHTLLVDIKLLEPRWGLRFHLMWTNFHCIFTLCPPKRWLADKQ